MQLERATAVDDRVPGVVTALEANDVVHVVGEKVGDLALALVAPLGTDKHDTGHVRTPRLLGPADSSLPLPDRALHLSEARRDSMPQEALRGKARAVATRRGGREWGFTAHAYAAMLVSDNYGRFGQEYRCDFMYGTEQRNQGGAVSRRNVILGAAALVTIALAVGLIVRVFFSGPPADRMVLAGDVRSVVRTISAPAISYPTVTYSVQVVSNAAMGEKTQTLSGKVVAGPQASATTSAALGVPVVSGRLSAVNVQVGDHVTTGTVLAQLDTTTLDLGVA